MANRIPVFIEVVESQQHAAVQVCRKIMAVLFKQKIAPLPLAGTLPEFHVAQRQLSERGLKPSIYVINSYWAEELLAQLAPLVADTPVVLFNRKMFSSETAIGIRPMSKRDIVSEVVRQMQSRQVCVWPYGSRNAEEMAQRAAVGILNFLVDGDFEHIKIAQSTDETEPAPAVPTETKPEPAASPPPPEPPFIDRFMRATATVQKSTPAPPLPAAAVAPAVPPAPSMSGLHGALTQMSMASLLSTLDMDRKSGVLSILRDGTTAQLLLCKGRVVTAQMLGPGVPSECRSGIESVYHVLMWKSGIFNFVASEINVPDEIKASTTQLLMEAARRSDEPAEQATPP